MAAFKEVPVVEVHKGNFKELWPSLMLAIKNATFLATDVELTGLGTKKLLFAKSIDDRFKEICNTARTRSIISLGISCFKIIPPQVPENIAVSESSVPQKDTVFQVQTFNIWILCSENFTVDPVSVQFLIEHGFDFNKQYATGLPYYRGNDKGGEETHPSLRLLFTELVRSGVPVVFHNAMVDLIFLYQSFYADAPSSLQTFTADLSEVFRGGIFDTKYIAEFKARMPASYLEYVFRKCQRDNLGHMEKGLRHASVQFLSYPSGMKDLVVLPCSLEIPAVNEISSQTSVCLSYANHGWCSYGNNCSKSHDIDEILDNEDHVSAKKKKKRQRKHKNFLAHSVLKTNDNQAATSQGIDAPKVNILTETEDSSGVQEISQDIQLTSTSNCDNDIAGKKLKTSDTSDSEQHCSVGNEDSSKAATKTCGHRAGFDSFMTGFAFATFFSRYGSLTSQRTKDQKDVGMEEFINKVYLSGKDIPLLIQKGNFSKTSKDHREKLAKMLV